MSKKINTGGAAFPRQVDWRPTEMSEPIAFEEFGMTLRDYFAAQIVAGMWACSETSGTYEQVAQGAYDQADAMLKAREES